MRQVTTALGPEKRGRHFETAGPAGANASDSDEVVAKTVDDDLEAGRTASIEEKASVPVQTESTNKV